MNRMRDECAAWEKERAQLDAYEAETARLEAMLGESGASSSGAGASADPTAIPIAAAQDLDNESERSWTATDLGAEGLAQMELARKALGWTAPFFPDDEAAQAAAAAIDAASASGAGAGARRNRGRASRGRGRASGARGGVVEAEAEESGGMGASGAREYKGTELDERWADVEFNVSARASPLSILFRARLERLCELA